MPKIPANSMQPHPDGEYQRLWSAVGTPPTPEQMAELKAKVDEAFTRFMDEAEKRRKLSRWRRL